MHIAKKKLNKILGNWAKSWKKDKIESATGLGRITREQIERWNQMTALGFQTGTSSKEPGIPSGQKNII